MRSYVPNISSNVRNFNRLPQALILRRISRHTRTHVCFERCIVDTVSIVWSSLNQAPPTFVPEHDPGTDAEAVTKGRGSDERHWSRARTRGTRRRKSLSEKQLAILEVIQRSVSQRGYPPSMREIGDAVGLSSLSSVTHQLNQLELSGYLRRDPNRPRALEVLIDVSVHRIREPRLREPDPGRRRRDGPARRTHRRRRARSRPSSRSKRSSRSPASSSARATSSC